MGANAETVLPVRGPIRGFTVKDQRDLLAEFAARVAEDGCCQAHRDEADELLAKVARMGVRGG